MNGIHVTSEIGKLKKVCLHRPGDELLNLPPDELERLLFDDVPYLEVAQQEHDRFAEILREQGVEVLYLEKLVAEAFAANPGARDEFLDQYLAEAGIHGQKMPAIVREYLNTFTDDLEFVKKTMAGVAKSEIDMPLASSATLDDLVSDHSDKQSDLIIDPMPNLYFTRDPFAMIGNGVSINRMYSVTRNRETIYGEYIFNYHPDFKGTPQYYSRYNTFHIEGGDILNINEHVLAIGISQRTEPDAIDGIAHNIFNDPTSPVDTILAFNIPNNRAMMHLDTVFTQIDVDKFTIHPGIMGPLSVFEITPEGDGIKVHEINAPLEQILEKYIGMPVTLIPCGGGDRIAAEREQWNDGSNTLCVRPGTVVVYQRNNVTNEVLYKEGLNLLVVPSAELSRGRGGPRCMSMPIWRED